jgi:hypothetical protein
MFDDINSAGGINQIRNTKIYLGELTNVSSHSDWAKMDISGALAHYRANSTTVTV